MIEHKSQEDTITYRKIKRNTCLRTSAKIKGQDDMKD